MEFYESVNRYFIWFMNYMVITTNSGVPAAYMHSVSSTWCDIRIHQKDELYWGCS
ncbi:hypothetical protein BJX76DRAFT_9934 [Aspergillus varians]